MTIRLCGISALLASVESPATAAPRTARVASITDGDTFRTTTSMRIRIANVDAPDPRRGAVRPTALTSVSIRAGSPPPPVASRRLLAR